MTEKRGDRYRKLADLIEECENSPSFDNEKVLKILDEHFNSVPYDLEEELWNYAADNQKLKDIKGALEQRIKLLEERVKNLRHFATDVADFLLDPRYTCWPKSDYQKQARAVLLEDDKLLIKQFHPYEPNP